MRHLGNKNSNAHNYCMKKIIKSKKSEREKLIILCGSYFDRLGHPIFAKKIGAELSLELKNDVEIWGISNNLNQMSSTSGSGAFASRVILSHWYNIDSRNLFKQRYGRIGSLIYWFIRLSSVTHFYWNSFRSIYPGNRVIDLECEPVQAFIASVFSPVAKEVRIGYVIHSMPKDSKSFLMKIYKYVSLAALRFLLRHSSRRAIFMTTAALEYAVNKGIARDRCILGGWGYDISSSKRTFLSDRSIESKTIVLAFGVLRKDKRIEHLVERFLELDDPGIVLRVIGKSLDVDISNLIKRIDFYRSQTIIEISDSYIEEDKIEELFVNSDIVVLSHSEGFESMSGPMFLAIQYERPILCFSGHAVASLVLEAGAGVVLCLSDDNAKIRLAISQLKNWRYDQLALQSFTWSAIAKRMIDW